MDKLTLTRPEPKLFGQVAVLTQARASCPSCTWSCHDLDADNAVWLAKEHALVTGHAPEVVLTWRPERRAAPDGPTTYVVTFTEQCEVQAESREQAVSRADALLGPATPRALRATVHATPF